MSKLDYIISERFIHDDLLQRANAAVTQVYEIWRNEGKIEPSLLTWPADPIPSDNGEVIEGVCCMTLPETSNDRPLAIRKMVERTKAYALLLVEQRDKDVRVILESPHGTRCWSLPIYRSGDAMVLAEPHVNDNREYIGLLWAPNRATA